MTEVPLELSRLIPLDRIRADGLSVAIEATPDERNAVAGRLQEPLVEALTCTFMLRRQEGSARAGEIAAEGRLRARVQRECVVSLDLFIEEIDEAFRVRFVPEGSESEDDDPESVDEIPYAGSAIDLGEAAVEQLALALDPYPRKPGAQLPAELAAEASGPFAALARLARKERSDGEPEGEAEGEPEGEPEGEH
jgi:uncharacterized metal-binding protein YceD (DUF177 family)